MTDFTTVELWRCRVCGGPSLTNDQCPHIPTQRPSSTVNWPRDPVTFIQLEEVKEALEKLAEKWDEFANADPDAPDFYDTDPAFRVQAECDAADLKSLIQSLEGGK